jgi:hypothetical protein
MRGRVTNHILHRLRYRADAFLYSHRRKIRSAVRMLPGRLSCIEPSFAGATVEDHRHRSESQPELTAC